MSRIFHNRLTTAGLIAIVALAISIPAVSFGQGAGGSGTAVAAKSTKKANKRGPKGAKGDKGDSGSLGPVGPTGAKGDTGPQGLQGASGAKGEPCLPSDPNCKGPKGDKGDAGSITGTLPTGVTLRGTYALRDTATTALESIQQPISFGFTLAAAPTPHYINIGAPVPAGCTGTTAAPGADSGNLCIFESLVENTGPHGEFDPVSGKLQHHDELRSSGLCAVRRCRELPHPWLLGGDRLAIAA